MGECVGCSVGACEGASVGATDGFHVGDADGSKEGDPVEAWVCCANSGRATAISATARVGNVRI